MRSIDDLYSRIDAMRLSDKIFTGLRIEGCFSRVYVRIACKSEPGTDLMTATHDQAEFHLTNIEGTLVVFYAPEYAHTIGVSWTPPSFC